jgi:integrase
MKKLTDTALRAVLKNLPKVRTILLDSATDGLELRVGPHSATWSLVFRVKGEGGVSQRGFKKKGKRHRITIGDYPTTSLETARAQANVFLAQAKAGVNPIFAFAASATAGGCLVKDLAKAFMDDYVRLKELRAERKYEMAIDTHINPKIGETLVDVLTRDEVRDLLKKVSVKVPRGPNPLDRPQGGKEAARTVLGILRKMINWGIKERKLKRQDNPAEGMESDLPKKRRRERVLSMEEMQLAWVAAGTLNYPFGPVYRLLQVTANRKGEWDEAIQEWIHLREALAVIPADHYKTDHVHVVPLVPCAVQILADVYVQHPRSQGPYIFSGTNGENPLQGWSKAQDRLLRAMCGVSGDKALKRFTPHDIRRSVATRLAEMLGIAGEQLIKRVLGHKDSSVTAIYNRYGYVREMRAALNELAAQISRYEPIQLVTNIELPRAANQPSMLWVPKDVA